MCIRDRNAPPTSKTSRTTSTTPRSSPPAGPSPCLLYTSDAADDLLCVDLGGRRLFQAEDGIRDRSPSRGLGDVYKRQECATYLENKQDYLDYPAFLAAGWPIA